MIGEPARPAPPSGSLVASIQPTRAALAGRILAWFGLAAVLVVVLFATGRPTAPAVRDLAGRWEATVDGAPVPGGIELPGLFARAGVPADARLIGTRVVKIGDDEPLALLIDRPQYAVTATWDGVAIGAVGDPALTGRDARSSNALFVQLPASPRGSTHVLGLDIRGDYGKGGILGRILVGPVPEVHAAALSTEVQRLAFALGVSLLAALPLFVATRSAWRPAYVAYGLFATTLAVQSAAQSNLAYDLLPNALAVTRLLRGATPLIGPLGVAFAAEFVNGALRPADRVLLAIGCVLATMGLVAPAAWLYVLELLGEGMLIACAGRYAMHAWTGLRVRVTGGPLLAAAVVPVLFALVSEITLTHGLRTGSSHLLVAGLLFTVALGAALVLRDADTSEQHERLVRGSLDAMVSVERSGRIRDANPAAHRLLTSMATGDPFLRFVASDDRIQVRAHLERALRRADRAEFWTAQDRAIESLATPLGADLVILTLRDITVRRELDQGLLHAARMETVAVLLGGIAHDFNNMLSTMLAHLGLLRARVPAEAERIDRMEAVIDRASDLTRRLLTIARGTGSELGPVDLSVVVAGAIELVEPTLPQSVRLFADLPADLPPVLGAAGDLEQVVVNLLVNARDAVGARGTLRVVARAFRHGERGHGACLMVEDDGPGVPAARAETMFQPFVTTKPSGTGLGLAVARQILRDHLGRIWFEPNPTGGARFLVALQHAEAMVEPPEPMPTGRDVMLVEDEQVLLEDYARALTDAGYRVAPFHDGTEAARWLASHTPDVLVTDVVVPGVNGLDLASICLEHHPETPVLFVSAFVPQQTLKKLPDKSWHALNKPVRAGRLVATVGRIRRRTERRDAGDEEITWVSTLFPDLADLTAADLGFDRAPDAPADPSSTESTPTAGP